MTSTAKGLKKLGILGGMGPAATARLFSQIVSFTSAQGDQGHLDITIFNRPELIPDRTAYLLGREGAVPFAPTLSGIAQELCGSGCEVLAMPCNTAHAGYEEIVAQLPEQVSFVNMLDETAAYLTSEKKRRIGLLATDGTLQTGVYLQAFERQGLELVAPCTRVQQDVMSIIYDYVKAGKQPSNDMVKSALDDLVDSGCDAIVLGCTELSLLGAPSDYRNCRVIDALDVLAWRCVLECGAQATRLP